MTSCEKIALWEQVVYTIEDVVLRMETGYASMSEDQRKMIVPNRFDSIIVPDIPIREYIAHFHRYAECSDSCYALAFIYIDRAIIMSPGLTLSMRSVHRLFIASIVLAIKYIEDKHANNAVYSNIGGISSIELNNLVIEMIN